MTFTDGWPWYDKLVVGAVIGGLVFSCFLIVGKLDRIIELLERLNKR